MVQPNIGTSSKSGKGSTVTQQIEEARRKRLIEQGRGAQLAKEDRVKEALRNAQAKTGKVNPALKAKGATKGPQTGDGGGAGAGKPSKPPKAPKPAKQAFILQGPGHAVYDCQVTKHGVSQALKEYVERQGWDAVAVEADAETGTLGLRGKGADSPQVRNWCSAYVTGYVDAMVDNRTAAPGAPLK